MVIGAGFLRALADAAALRGMTPTAYCRRAVAAFVSADTDIAFERLTAECPHPDGRDQGTCDPGTGHGQWVASRFVDDTDVI